MRINNIFLLSAGCMVLLLGGGCSASSSRRVGIRVFNEHPRFHDDDVWVFITRAEGGDYLACAPVPSGGHFPIEVHNLLKGQSVVLSLRYDWLGPDAMWSVATFSRYPLDLSDDVDVRIHWDPYMPIYRDYDQANDDTDEELIQQSRRKPRIVVTEGHSALW